ncbi:MAG: hypothetical protein F4Z15_07240 [Gammaproteobacteria bacterium]|nr:hypothetical protein [Gammaproteobacteria bacterium]MYD76930.1 hypothetical protein [Gammaproteobacteria bacterium]MYJ52190.1 hypothetical protein [Gammaproteobacteria bacterium]
MQNIYYETIKRLEQMKVQRQYILGWASGYLGNPEIEEQRMTDAWQAGYDDGKARSTDEAENWKE